MRIGVFDSGIGGLTVLKELRNRYPYNDYIYVGDNINLPYGKKSKEEIIRLSYRIMDFLIDKKVDMCVIACGTISSNAYSELKEKYNIKIVDIITPIIRYIKENNIDNVGVFATEATINSHIFKKLLPDIKVYEEACPEFVPLIEGNKILSKEMEESIAKHLKNIPCNNIILGCTHYPIIEELIDAETINMGKNIYLYSDTGNSSCKYYFSYKDEILEKNVYNIVGKVDIEKW